MLVDGTLIRAELYDKHSAPYTGVNQVYEANKNRHPNLRLVVCNAHWYAPGAKPCGNYKVAGKVVSQELDRWTGFGWVSGEQPEVADTMVAYDYFLSTIPAIIDGKVGDMSAANWGSGVARRCNRTWWGFRTDGSCVVEVTTTGYTLQETADRMVGMGITNGLILDGSGSSQYYDGTTWHKGDGRIVYSYLLLWFKEEKDNMAPLICIDAGHGKNTAGKRCMKSLDPNETREWVLNDRMAKRLGKELEKRGYKVKRVDDTSGEVDVTLTERVARANKANATAYVSIHHNAGINGGSGGGICVFASENASDTSLKLQDAVYRATVAKTGLKGNRATPKPLKSFHVIKHTKMPAILGEFGFMDSATDVPIILSDSFSQKCAEGIAEGIAEVLGAKKLPTEKKIYRVQLGAFSDRSNAVALQAELKKLGYDTIIKED